MSTTEKSKIVQLGVDLAKGSLGNFSKSEAEEGLRNALNELLGGEKNIRRAFRKNSAAIFTVMEEILDILITEGIEGQFEQYVEYRAVAHGDRPIFMQEDYKLFPVATIASGVNSIRRQRLDRTGLYVPTSWKGVEIYEEMERFLAGRTDWSKMINKVQRSFNAQISADINTALVNGYSALTAPYKYNGTWDLTQFNTLVSHIEAATDHKAMVVGTKLALQTVSPAYVAYGGQMVDDRNKDGFFKVIDGTVLAEIKQAHVPGTDNFAINNKNLLILPEGEEKIVKLVLEGESEIRESGINNNQNEDDSVEYLFRKKYGVAVVTSTKYGAYLLP